MNTERILDELREERRRLDTAIEALEGSEPNTRKTRMVYTPRKKRTLSAAGRRAISQAQKARWAIRKATAKK